MALVEADSVLESANPVDLIEYLASANDWTFERSGEDEITISVDGQWTTYHVTITWMDEMEALHIASAFDIKVPQPRLVEAARLVQAINEQLWIGHFDLWGEERAVMFRHSHLMAGGAEINAEQCAALLEAAVNACEKHYQAFQFVVWAGESARSALDMALFETHGEA